MTILPELQKMSAVQLRELDLRHVIHPHQQAARTERCVIVRGQGCTVWDADGNEYLDATGSANWLAQVGHGRRELVEVAAQQMSGLAYFTGWASSPTTRRSCWPRSWPSSRPRTSTASSSPPAARRASSRRSRRAPLPPPARPAGPELDHRPALRFHGAPTAAAPSPGAPDARRGRPALRTSSGSPRRRCTGRQNCTAARTRPTSSQRADRHDRADRAGTSPR